MTQPLEVTTDLTVTEQANSLTVTDAKSEAVAAKLFSECDAQLKAIEARRKEKTAPLNELVKGINATAKRLSEPFAEAKSRLSGLMSDWRTSEDVREAEEMRRSAEHNAAHFAKEGDLERAQGYAECANDISAIVPKTVKLEGSRVQFRTEIVIDSVDLSVLPEAFTVRTADERKIKHALISGDVPGVKWHEERKAVNVRI